MKAAYETEDIGCNTLNTTYCYLSSGGHLRYDTVVWTPRHTHHQLDCDSVHLRSLLLYHSHRTGSSCPHQRRCCSWSWSACHSDPGRSGHLRESVLLSINVQVFKVIVITWCGYCPIAFTHSSNATLALTMSLTIIVTSWTSPYGQYLVNAERSNLAYNTLQSTS